MKILRRTAFQIAAVLLLAAAWKGWILFWNVVPFNSDEAIVALMARHILAGERPVFFYGQAYMGSLDAFLVAGGFLIFGQHIWIIRLVQCLLYLGTLLTTIWIGREIFGSWRIGVLAGLLLAVPTVNVTLYTTASLGGYGEALLLGTLSLLTALRVAIKWEAGRTKLADWVETGIWGLLAGCGLWANGLSLVFSLPAGVYLAWRFWANKQQATLQEGARFALVGGAGILIGSLPWWLYAAGHGFHALVLELLGSAVAVERTSWLARTGAHLVNFLLLGISVIFGMRPPWSIAWLGLPLLPFVLAAWMGVVWFSLRQLRKGAEHRAGIALLFGIMVVLLAGFLFTAFGIDPSGRYFVPLAVPLALLAAWGITFLARRGRGARIGAALLVVLLLGYQAWGTIQCALANPPGITTQFDQTTIIDHSADAELIAFLRAQSETRGYSNYWVAYPLVFQSAEELIFIPRLPYHLDLRYTPRDDRYAPYTEMVSRSQRTAYITTRNPLLDDTLREGFTKLGIAWQEKLIGDYRVYYHLSRAVRPQEIGLGELRP